MCPVCGYELGAIGVYYICPCCGTEFGIHDVNASIQNLRLAWICKGCHWWSASFAKPAMWNPYDQLRQVRSLECGVA